MWLHASRPSTTLYTYDVCPMWASGARSSCLCVCVCVVCAVAHTARMLTMSHSNERNGQRLVSTYHRHHRPSQPRTCARISHVCSRPFAVSDDDDDNDDRKCKRRASQTLKDMFAMRLRARFGAMTSTRLYYFPSVAVYQTNPVRECVTYGLFHNLTIVCS